MSVSGSQCHDPGRLTSDTKFVEWPQIARYLRGQPTVRKLWEAAEQFSDKKSIYWKQEKLFYVRVFHIFFTQRPRADPHGVDGSSALAQVHPTQEHQESASRHWR